MGNIAAVVKNFFKGLLCDDNGKPSLSDCISLTLALAFLGVSLYLATKDLVWQHYDAFALYSVGPSSALKAASKYINSMKRGEVK